MFCSVRYLFIHKFLAKWHARVCERNEKRNCEIILKRTRNKNTKLFSWIFANGWISLKKQIANKKSEQPTANNKKSISTKNKNTYSNVNLNWLWKSSFYFVRLHFDSFLFLFLEFRVCVLSSRVRCNRPDPGAVTHAAHGTGSFWRCFAVWNTEGGTIAKSTHINRKNVVEFLKKSTAVMVPADRQSAGDEIIWQQEGIGQGANTSEDGRTLGHSSMQLIQVNTPSFRFFLHFFLVFECRMLLWIENQNHRVSSSDRR